MINPLLLVDKLADEATAILKMPMNTEQEVALYEQGIRLTAQAWQGMAPSYAEEALAAIQTARESGEHTAEPEFMCRPPEATRELLQNLAFTMIQLPLNKQGKMAELIQFATDYPEPLMLRYHAETAQSEALTGPAL